MRIVAAAASAVRDGDIVRRDDQSAPPTRGAPTSARRQIGKPQPNGYTMHVLRDRGPPSKAGCRTEHDRGDPKPPGRPVRRGTDAGDTHLVAGQGTADTGHRT